MLKYKRYKYNNKNILFSSNQIKKQEEEQKQKEKEEKLTTLKILQEEFYSDNESEEESEELLELIELLDKIKSKNKLMIFVKEYKQQINNLEKEDKEKILTLIQNKYF